VDLKTPSWESALLLYNSGTVYLSKGDIDLALLRFTAIAFQPTFPLSFVRAVHINQALAYLQNASDEASKGDSTAALWHAFRAFQGLNQAPPGSGMEERKAAALAELSRIYTAYETKEKLDSSAAHQLFLQLAALKEFLGPLKELTAVRGEMLKIYLDRAVKVAKMLPPLEGTHLLEKGEVEQALVLFSKAEEAMVLNLKELWEKMPLEELLLEAFNDYLKPLLDPFSSQELLPLIALLLEEAEKKAAERGVDMQLLKEVKALSIGASGEELRFYFAAKRFALQEILSELNAPKKNLSVEELLQSGIRKEKTALFLNQLQSEQPTNDLSTLTLLGKAQRRVLSAVAPVKQSALQAEEHAFFEEGLCQESPWMSFFPLFNLGVGLALEAEKLLSQGETESAALKQKSALLAFDEALNVLKEPPPPPREENHEETALVKTRQELLQSINQDKKLMKAPMKGSVEEVEKPW